MPTSDYFRINMKELEERKAHMTKLQERIAEAAKIGIINNEITIYDLTTGKSCTEIFSINDEGIVSYKKVKFSINGVKYTSSDAVQKEYNIRYMVVIDRCKSLLDEWKGWVALDWR